MSTILKALRRLEEDQSLEQSHSLRERVVSGLGDQPSSSTRLKIALLVVGGFASAAVGGLVFTVWTGQSAPASLAVATAATDVAAYSPIPGTASARSGTALPVGQLADKRPEPRQPPMDSAASLEVDEVVELGSWTDGFEEASPAPAGLSPLSPDSAGGMKFAEDIALVIREEPSLPRIDDLNRTAVAPVSPLARQAAPPLPTVRRAKVPSVEVIHTIWHPRPERRQAVLRIANQDELVRLSEGDAVGPLVVLEIQPAGVVFDHGGLQIQRRVGTGP